jgi:hypothetical protein
MKFWDWLMGKTPYDGQAIEFEGEVLPGGCTIFTAQFKVPTLLKELRIESDLTDLQINDLKLAGRQHPSFVCTGEDLNRGAKPATATLGIGELGMGMPKEQITLSVTNNDKARSRRFRALVLGASVS